VVLAGLSLDAVFVFAVLWPFGLFVRAELDQICLMGFPSVSWAYRSRGAGYCAVDNYLPE